MTEYTVDPLLIDANELKRLLRENIMNVVFTKADGTSRAMNCTLQESYLPDMLNKVTKPRPKNSEAVVVWDIDKRDWRSFRYDTVQHIKTVS